MEQCISGNSEARSRGACEGAAISKSPALGRVMKVKVAMLEFFAFRAIS
jgi:hypothetical protein